MTYFCYVDEAGDTRSLLTANAQNVVPVCAIVGVIVDQACLRQLTPDFLNLKAKWFPHLVSRPHFLDSVKNEIKGADLRRAMRTGASRRKRRHALGFLDHLVALIEQYDMHVVGRLTIKEIGPQINERALYTSCVQAISNYFNHFLDDRQASGLILADSRTPALNAQVSHSIFTQKFKAIDQYPTLLEMPMFGHSENHVGIQVADLVASALFFPMATHAFCLGRVTNVHVDTAFGQLRQRYGQRLQRRQFRFRVGGRIHGGVTVNDGIGHRSGAQLFQP